MHVSRSFLWIAVIAVTAVVLTIVPTHIARASEARQTTYLTFSAPVEIPGVVLPAGTYRFELADSTDGTDPIRVYSKSGSKLYATFLSIPVSREHLTSKPVVVLEKADPNGLEAVKSWFYPDDLVGHKFVYPTPEAQMIAAANLPSAHRAD